MKNLKDELARAITSRPDIIQFSKDRKYEEAWIIELDKKKPSDKQIDEYLNKEKFETIIVEYIWNSKDDDHRFVLTVFLDKKCRLQDSKEFINITLDNFYQYQNFKNLLETIDGKIIGREFLLINPVDGIHLGIFNYWLSTKPIELWNRGVVYDFEKIKAKIEQRPNIKKTTLNYQGLLFRFNASGSENGPYYGIKTPCCNKLGKEWIINYEKVDYWIKLMLN